MVAMASKSLDNETKEAVRRFAKKVVDLDFDGNITRAARAIGAGYTMLYETIHGSRGAGMSTINRLVAYTKYGMNEVVGGTEYRGIRTTTSPYRWIDKAPDYPNLAIGLEIASQEGVPDWFLDEYREQRLKSRVDHPTLRWLNEIRDEYPRRLKERVDPAYAAKVQAQREADLKEADAMTRPELPWTKPKALPAPKTPTKKGKKKS